MLCSAVFETQLKPFGNKICILQPLLVYSKLMSNFNSSVIGGKFWQTQCKVPRLISKKVVFVSENTSLATGRFPVCLLHTLSIPMGDLDVNAREQTTSSTRPLLVVRKEVWSTVTFPVLSNLYMFMESIEIDKLLKLYNTF